MSTFDSEIIRLCNRLDVKDAVIGLLGDSLKERDERVTMLRTIIKDNDTTISTMSKHMDYMREAVVSYSREITNLNNKLDTKDTIILDLKKAIKEQADALRDMSKLLADCRTELTRGTR